MHELSERDRAILAMIEDAFSNVTRPDHFTNYLHCEECAEHDHVLRSREWRTISRDDLGQTGWNPITFTTPHGFAYYFPGLARVALEHPISSKDDWYAGMLLSQLAPCATLEDRKQFLSLSQRAAIASFLRHLLDTRDEDLKCSLTLEDAQEALRSWSV